MLNIFTHWWYRFADSRDILSYKHSHFEPPPFQIARQHILWLQSEHLPQNRCFRCQCSKSGWNCWLSAFHIAPSFAHHYPHQYCECHRVMGAWQITWSDAHWYKPWLQDFCPGWQSWEHSISHSQSEEKSKDGFVKEKWREVKIAQRDLEGLVLLLQFCWKTRWARTTMN